MMAASLLSGAFEEFRGVVIEGLKETELAKAAVDLIYAKGASHVDDMLVQSGARSADPHGLPSPKRIGRGESIIMDVGAAYEGYYADVTRAFCVGESREMEKIYAKVLEANVAGISESEAGVRVGIVDAAARGVLKIAGLGR